MDWKELEHTLMLDKEVYGNTVEQWLIALGIALVVYGLLAVVRPIIIHRLSTISDKTQTQIDDFIISLVRDTRQFLLVILSLWSGTLILAIPANITEIINNIPILALLLQAAFWGHAVVEFALTRYAETRKTEQDRLVTTTMVGPLRYVGLTIIWSIVLLMALDNIGVDVTAMVTGLGIGGIAVALAVQNVLGDVFSAFAIIIDKPFVVGDFIIVDDLMGNVEHIGLKTTRVRSLSGEQLVFANSDLLSSRIRNYKRMYERRIVFKFGVLYQTSAEQLKAIPGMVQEIVDAQENVRFDRSHLAGFGDSSLDFETVYYVTVPEYDIYMDVQQAINLAVFEKFEAEDIGFAYPTRTLFVTHENSAIADFPKMFK